MITEIFRYPYDMIRPVYERTSFHRSVIDEIDDHQLREAYTVCRQITRKYAKTFYLATRFLPNHKQRSIFAIYALCRFLDDMVDETEDLVTTQKLQLEDVFDLIETQKSRLLDVYEGNDPGGHPIFVAFAHTLKTFHIPIKLPFELIDGVSMDLTKKRYETFEEVYGYSWKVASVVGLMTSEVFGYEDPSALEYAADLGIAMQLTNILRDVGEDLGRGRIYLPAEDLRAFGITEEDLFARKVTPEFKALMEFQIQRAESYYAKSDAGIAMLSSDSRLPVSMARLNYSRILQQIRENEYQVFDQRAHLSTAKKLAILPRLWMGVL
jgi:phytoene synthase